MNEEDMRLLRRLLIHLLTYLNEPPQRKEHRYEIYHVYGLISYLERKLGIK
jgi:hypothetical protein